MEKFLDLALGLPGLLVFCALVVVGAAMTPGHSDEVERCEKLGGKRVYQMKSFHSCVVKK